MAALLDEGMRAMAVEVDAVVGVAGFVQPGDIVDVITTMDPDDETKEQLANEADRISKIILQNIKVLAVGEHLSTEGRKPVKVKVVTLSVTPDQSERLALGSQHGRIQLTMRSRIDLKQEPTAGVTPLDLLTPDEGAEVAVRDKDTIPRRTYGSRRKKKDDKETAPAAPTVEIIRGTRIEERKLRTYDNSR
jgi:pilus assembly protein CpaB